MRRKTGLTVQFGVEPPAAQAAVESRLVLAPDNPDQDQAGHRRSDTHHAQDIVRRRQRAFHRPPHPGRAGREHQAFQHKQNTHTDEEVGERYGPHRTGTSRFAIIFWLLIQAEAASASASFLIRPKRQGFAAAAGAEVAVLAVGGAAAADVGSAPDGLLKYLKKFE